MSDNSNSESWPNDRRHFSIYWLEILATFTVVLILVLTVLAAIVGFTKGLHTFNLPIAVNSTITSSGSDIICRKSSKSGKSCSLDVAHTRVLFSLNKKSNIDNYQYIYYSSEYTALSDLSIVTFSISTNSKYYLDDISVYDPILNIELISGGSFSSGTMDSYCLCGSDVSLGDIVKPASFASHTPDYGCQIDVLLSPVKISQVIDTLSSRQYNVSFWIKVPVATKDFSLIVYMSSVVI